MSQLTGATSSNLSQSISTALPLYRKAIAQLESARQTLPDSVWLAVYNFAFGSPNSPTNIADVRKGIKAAQPALQTLRQAVKLPHMRMGNWAQAEQNPDAILSLPFACIREFARLLRAEALLRKRDGNIDGAVESCLTAFKLVRRMGDEPTLTGFSVQSAIFGIPQEALWHVLSDSEASPKAYRQLLSELQAWDINRDFVRAL